VVAGAETGKGGGRGKCEVYTPNRIGRRIQVPLIVPSIMQWTNFLSPGLDVIDVLCCDEITMTSSARKRTRVLLRPI
jgi:hypothetical protein